MFPSFAHQQQQHIMFYLLSLSILSEQLTVDEVPWNFLQSFKVPTSIAKQYTLPVECLSEEKVSTYLL